MEELRESRVVKVVFHGPAPEPPNLPGLVNRQREGTRLTLQFDGPLPPLLQWLGSQPVVDLRITPLGLGPIYHRYHGAAA
jgi:hypothetical protein